MQEGRNLQIQIVPETVLANQWHPKRRANGERRLCLAILEEALECLKLHADCNASWSTRTRTYDRSVNRSRIAREAMDWILSEADHPFSFRFICAMLEIEPDWFRRKLRGLRFSPGGS